MGHPGTIRARTGVPGVLNTSLNARGLPICETPEDSFSLFQESELGAILLEEYVIEKQ